MANQYQVKGGGLLVQCHTFQEAWNYYLNEKIYKISFKSLEWENVSHTWHRWVWYTKKEFLEWMAEDENVDYSSELIQKAYDLSPAFSQTDDDDEKSKFWIDMPMEGDRFFDALISLKDKNLSKDEEDKACHRMRSLIWIMYDVLTEAEFKTLYWECS